MVPFCEEQEPEIYEFVYYNTEGVTCPSVTVPSVYVFVYADV